jgi:hypothetical protein
MQMIRHTVYGDHFMFMISYNPGYVLMQLNFPYRLNERLSEFYREYALDMDLGVGMWHGTELLPLAGQMNFFTQS